ncbi:potassium channel family protein [Candidatus Halobonum tyrrellensis]|uniref:Ion channel n=1 Tax=Candidatus Halobonum tyrrellensis G22 TaxID=1324957 RepID=V4HK40_9EURY|nr:potassium channel family protein [Candidatus Halobonum tyrrellensis]ESP90153.1 Ion channel [Candidatus Halobonum tyrrellensis G22]
MTLLYTVVGAVVLVGTVTDLLWTTVWVEGRAGPVTTRLMAGTWNRLRRVGGRGSRLLTLAGPLVLLVSLVTWIASLWLGWTLVFAGVEGSIVETNAAGPVSWSERFYFTGYSLFTLGNGGYAPGGAVWRIVTVFTSGSGMLFVTLIVTYVLSVLDAVTQKRAFASTVSGLGETGGAVVVAGWTGERFDGFDLPLNSVSTQLNELTVNHMAYPVLHYFYTADRRYAAVVGVATLDEALTTLQRGVPERRRSETAVVESARSTVDTYLEMVDATFAPADDPPPAPDLDRLREAGVPTVSDEAFDRRVAELADRRRDLLGLVEADGHRWSRDDG